jgi:hypothetical protein
MTNFKKTYVATIGTFIGDGSKLTNITATSASYAATASLLLGTVISASYALTASYAMNGGGGGGTTTGSFTGSFTGSLLGTASWSNNASTASYVSYDNMVDEVQLSTISSFRFLTGN